MEECPICSLNSVIEEQENGRMIRVCTECGAMDDDMQEYAAHHEGTTLTDGQGRAPSAARPSVKSTSSAQSMKIGLKYGIDAIKSFGKILHFDETMMGEACSLYERAFPGELTRATFDTRLAMSVACIYVTGRLHQSGIAVRDVAQFLPGQNGHVRFGKSLKKLKTKYNVDLPPTSLISEAHCLLAQVHLPKEVIEVTKKVLVLMEHLYLTQARATCVNITVASYFAWQAHDYVNNRKTTMSSYCKQYNFNDTTQTKDRKVETENALRALVVQLPWMNSWDNKKKVDIAPHLQDILKYQSSLRQGAILSAITKLRQCLEENGEKDDDDIEQKLEVYIEHGHVFRRVRKKPHQGDTPDEMSRVKKSKIEDLSDGNSDTDTESHKHCGASDNGNIKEDIEDDVNCYIRTESEVLGVQQLLSKFKDESGK